MNILKVFSEHEALSLNEICEITNIPKTSVVRMVSSLEEMGFLVRQEDRKYALGLMFLHFGQLVSERMDVRKIALPIMYNLRDQINEAVNLIIPDGNEAIYVEKVDTSQMVRVYTRIGRRAPFYAGACPRILLAFMPDDRRDQYLDSVDLKKIASGTIVDKYELYQLLSESRKTGYAVSFSELEDGSAAVAAPIRNHEGNVIAAISIAGPESRFREYLLQNLVDRVLQAALQISLKLGWYSDGIN